MCKTDNGGDIAPFPVISYSLPLGTCDNNFPGSVTDGFVFGVPLQSGAFCDVHKYIKNDNKKMNLAMTQTHGQKLEFFLFFLQLVKSTLRENEIAPICQWMLETDSMHDEESFALTLSTDKPI